ETYAYVQQHPVLQTSLRAAYWSGGVQLLALFLIHCMRAPGIGSGELLWNFMVSLLITIAISVILPAAAMPGLIGQHDIDVFMAVRSGGITVLDAPTIDGPVTCPSWHAAMRVIFTYSA